MEDVAVSFLFSECGNRSNSHVIVELADARDFWSACT